MSRIERRDAPDDGTIHDEANCPQCQREIAELTDQSPAPSGKVMGHYEYTASEIADRAAANPGCKFVLATDYERLRQHWEDACKQSPDAALSRLLERMMPYTSHVHMQPMCERVRGENYACTCGLDQLLRDVAAMRGEGNG